MHIMQCFLFFKILLSLYWRNLKSTCTLYIHNFLLFIRICSIGLLYQVISPTLPPVNLIFQGIPLNDYSLFFSC